MGSDALRCTVSLSVCMAMPGATWNWNRYWIGWHAPPTATAAPVAFGRRILDRQYPVPTTWRRRQPSALLAGIPTGIRCGIDPHHIQCSQVEERTPKGNAGASLTGAATGLECSLVEVEVNLAQGLPDFTVFGLPNRPFLCALHAQRLRRLPG